MIFMDFRGFPCLLSTGSFGSWGRGFSFAIFYAECQTAAVGSGTQQFHAIHGER